MVKNIIRYLASHTPPADIVCSLEYKKGQERLGTLTTHIVHI